MKQMNIIRNNSIQESGCQKITLNLSKFDKAFKNWWHSEKMLKKKRTECKTQFLLQSPGQKSTPCKTVNLRAFNPDLKLLVPSMNQKPFFAKI